MALTIEQIKLVPEINNYTLPNLSVKDVSGEMSLIVKHDNGLTAIIDTQVLLSIYLASITGQLDDTVKELLHTNLLHRLSSLENAQEENATGDSFVA